MKPRLIIYLLTVLLIGCESSDSPEKKLFVPDNDFKIVGYLHSGNFDKIDSIELDKLTYLNIAFANPDENGDFALQGDEDKMAEVIEKGHEAGLKVYLSIAGGGIDENERKWWQNALDPENRAGFIELIINYLDEYNMDGVDVDIEWNLLPFIGDLYTPFVIELKQALRETGRGISTALGATNLHEAVSQESLEAYDFINVMVYDATGVWTPEKPGPHSTYLYAQQAEKFWTEERNIPREKLVLGMPFYGHDFENVKYISYKNIVNMNPEYAYRDSLGLIYYNGIPTIVKKTLFAMRNFNGVMFWELGNDAFNELSLLRAVDQTLKARDCMETSFKTFYSDQDGDGYGNVSKPVQACDPPPGYVDNRADPDDTDPEIHP